MWVGVGILLGLVVVATVLGFHFGPHGHVVGAGLGVVAAVWLLVMAATGQARPILWVLFGADLALSAGLGAFAWNGLRFGSRQTGPAHPGIVGAEGVAVTALQPSGIVRVRGENWSATSMNGSVPAGTRVQVIESAGVRVNVWAEEDASLDEGDGPGRLGRPQSQHPFLDGEKREAQ